MQTDILSFRKATPADFDAIWEILLMAKAQMKRLNSTQWSEDYPSRELIEADIESGEAYLLCEPSGIIAYGVVSAKEEPAYNQIKDKWSNDLPYIVVHRMAVSDRYKKQGMARRFMEQAEQVARSRGISNFRVDTKYDNLYMQQLLKKTGFRYVGEVIYREDQFRDAFEKTILPERLTFGPGGFTLREVTCEDAETIFRAVDQYRDDLRTWLPFVDRIQDANTEKLFIIHLLKTPYKTRNLVFLIEKGDEFCGLIGIASSDVLNHRLELGYWLLPPWRGKGLITGAVAFLCRMAFEKRQINRIQIRCAVANQTSNAVPLRLGFTAEGIERDGELLASGEYTDIRVYSLLKKDWEALKKESPDSDSASDPKYLKTN